MRARAAALDAADPLAGFRDRFLPAPGVVAYLDGNSLGRPVAGVPDRLDTFVREEWAGRLIRGWTDGWMGWPEQVGDRIAAAVGPDTAVVLLSHVAYRSGWIADAAAITAIAHDAGALVLWDLSHSVGSVELDLDAWGVDLAAGCTYKYLGGGPGSPAFGYVRRGLHDRLRQPVQGWMGRQDPFEMGPGYTPAAGVRGIVSGTPPILAAVPLLAGLELLEEAGIAAVRAKSRALTAYALDLVDAWLPGVELVSPRDPDRRGGHLTIRRAGFRDVLDALWERGVIPDYREPDGIRLGLAPLSTSFTEVHDGLAVLRDLHVGDPR